MTFVEGFGLSFGRVSGDAEVSFMLVPVNLDSWGFLLFRALWTCGQPRVVGKTRLNWAWMCFSMRQFVLLNLRPCKNFSVEVYSYRSSLMFTWA